MLVGIWLGLHWVLSSFFDHLLSKFNNPTSSSTDDIQWRHDQLDRLLLPRRRGDEGPDAVVDAVAELDAAGSKAGGVDQQPEAGAREPNLGVRA